MWLIEGYPWSFAKLLGEVDWRGDGGQRLHYEVHEGLRVSSSVQGAPRQEREGQGYHKEIAVRDCGGIPDEGWHQGFGREVQRDAGEVAEETVVGSSADPTRGAR